LRLALELGDAFCRGLPLSRRTILGFGYARGLGLPLGFSSSLKFGDVRSCALAGILGNPFGFGDADSLGFAFVAGPPFELADPFGLSVPLLFSLARNLLERGDPGIGFGASLFGRALGCLGTCRLFSACCLGCGLEFGDPRHRCLALGLSTFAHLDDVRRLSSGLTTEWRAAQPSTTSRGLGLVGCRALHIGGHGREDDRRIRR